MTIFFNILNKLNTISADLPYSGQMSFQEPASNAMEYIIDVHHEICFYLVIVLIFVFWLIYNIIYTFSSPFYFWFKRFVIYPIFFNYRGWNTDEINKNLTNVLGNLILTSWTRISIIKGLYWEFWWTVIPTIFLTLIAIPSLFLIFNLDRYSYLISNINYLIKVSGNQWYWVYEYTNLLNKKVEISSVMLSSEDLITAGHGYRLLDVDNRLYLIEGQFWQFTVSSLDVIHSWALPSLGLKIDACPGRLNRIFVRVWRSGVFYGQCSEICGIYHGFMPIVLEILSICKFLNISLFVNDSKFW